MFGNEKGRIIRTTDIF